MKAHKDSARYRKLEEVLAKVYDVDKILEIAYDWLGNPILIHDMDYKAINFTKNICTDDPIWIDYVEHGTLSLKWLRFLETESFLDSAANTKKITFLLSDKLAYQRIYGKVFTAENLQIGCAIMVACNKPFEDADPELFELVCDALTSAYSRDVFFHTYGQAYFEKLLGKLIAGIENGERKYYIAHVESIYINLKTHLHLIAADTTQCSVDCGSLMETLKKAQPLFKYAAYAQYIMILASTETLINNELGALIPCFDRLNLFAGISSSFENLFALPKYYSEAIEALTDGLKCNQRISLYGNPPE